MVSVRYLAVGTGISWASLCMFAHLQGGWPKFFQSFEQHSKKARLIALSLHVSHFVLSYWSEQVTNANPESVRRADHRRAWILGYMID